MMFDKTEVILAFILVAFSILIFFIEIEFYPQKEDKTKPEDIDIEAAIETQAQNLDRQAVQQSAKQAVVLLAARQAVVLLAARQAAWQVAREAAQQAALKAAQEAEQQAALEKAVKIAAIKVKTAKETLKEAEKEAKKAKEQADAFKKMKEEEYLLQTEEIAPHILLMKKIKQMSMYYALLKTSYTASSAFFEKAKETNKLTKADTEVKKAASMQNDAEERLTKIYSMRIELRKKEEDLMNNWDNGSPRFLFF